MPWTWTIIKHKTTSQNQELHVCIIINEMARYCPTQLPKDFDYYFKQRLSGVKSKNSYSADLLYKAIPKDEKTVEIWKQKADGELNYKMFTLNLQGKTDNLFNF